MTLQKRRNTAIFNLDDSITFRISRLFSKLNTGLARQLGDRFNLLSREWRVMALLAQHQPMSASELVERSPMDKASVSRAVARLTEMGYIQAAPHPADGRMQTIRLSRSGWALYQKIAPESVARQSSLMSVLTPAEKKSLFAMLEKIEAQAVLYFSAEESGPPPGTGKSSSARARARP